MPQKSSGSGMIEINRYQTFLNWFVCSVRVSRTSAKSYRPIKDCTKVVICLFTDTNFPNFSPEILSMCSMLEFILQVFQKFFAIVPHCFINIPSHRDQMYYQSANIFTLTSFFVSFGFQQEPKNVDIFCHKLQDWSTDLSINFASCNRLT